MDFMCFNHTYPLMCVVIKREFKKTWGRVSREEITVKCPDCGMEITYCFKVKRYTRGD